MNQREGKGIMEGTSSLFEWIFCDNCACTRLIRKIYYVEYLVKIVLVSLHNLGVSGKKNLQGWGWEETGWNLLSWPGKEFIDLGSWVENNTNSLEVWWINEFCRKNDIWNKKEWL